MNKRRKWLIAALATGLVLGTGGVAAAYLAASQIPHGVTVLQIPVGGKSRAQAEAALRAGLDGHSTRPVTVRIKDRQTRLLPADVGLSVDVPATVARAAAHPRLATLIGRTKVEPVVTVDEKLLVAALKPTADGLVAAATMPAVRFEGLTVQPVYPVPGEGLGFPETAAAVTGAWLRHPVVQVPIVKVFPASTAADVDHMVEALAKPAVSAPVTITAGEAELTATPEHIASSLMIGSDDTGKLSPRVDEPALRAALQRQLAQVETRPRSAVVGDGRIVASEGGTVVDTAKLAGDLLTVLPYVAERTVRAAFQPVEPETSSAELAALGIKEQISSFTTHFTGGLDSPRSVNIVNGAKEVDGAILRPGETFSLNGHTGPRGYAEGYRDAPIIMNGKLTPGVGGGMSQFTTTLFNAAYYAGLEDVEHQPHTIYFSTYPSVIEATIFYPSLDLKFRNNTRYGVLIDTSYTADSITVSMWSTRVHDSVTTEWGAKRDFAEPPQITLPSGPKCIARTGSQGFAQDAWRVFRKGGKETAREKFTWRYDAEPRVTCG